MTQLAQTASRHTQSHPPVTAPMLAISSFSLHSVLGPLRLERRGDDGAILPLSFDFPREHSLDEFGALVVQRVGARAVELCQIQFDGDTPDRIAQLRAAMDDAGITVLTVPIDSGNLASGNAAWLADDEARIIRWFDIAGQLGAQYVRVNAGSPGYAMAADARPMLVQSLMRLGDAANARGLQLLVENHGGTSSDPDFMLGLLDDVGHDRLGLLLDLGNFEPLVTLSHGRFADPDLDDAGLDFEPLYDRIAALAPVARLVHAKSVDPARDGRPLPDLSRALMIVRAAGYNGHISVEWEGHRGDPWAQTAAVAAQVRAVFPALG
ncbi:MAG: sugar phosphate isomerase/epimerase family protein [Sphingopyxis sp.]